MDEKLTPIYTIGHSTRTIEEFLELLQEHGIELLLDIRTIPGSRRVPHFNSEVLTQALKERGIGYRHLKQLGGLRKPAKKSANTAWRNAAFRGFADYMQTQDFRNALLELLELASQKRVALMCAEAVPWRCHRSLVADALLVRGVPVRHILSRSSLRVHELTRFAVVDGCRITYPETAPEAQVGPTANASLSDTP